MSVTAALPSSSPAPSPGSHRALWQLTAGQRLRYGASILALAGSIVFLYGVPLVSQVALDGAISGSFPEWLTRLARSLPSAHRELWAAGLALVLLTAASGGFEYLDRRWAAGAAEAIAATLRARLFGHLLRLPQTYHDRADRGDLVQRCTSDVETLRMFLASQVGEIGRALLLVAIAVPALVYLDPRLALVALVLLPAIVLFAFFFFRGVQKRFLALDESEARLTTVVQENLTGVRVVRAFAQEQREEARFAEANADLRRRYESLFELSAIFWSSQDLLCLAQTGLILFAGAAALASGTTSVGVVFAFLTFHGFLILPVRRLGRTLTEAGKALVAIRRLEEILSEPEETAQDRPVHALASLGGAPAIRFEGVHFAYPDGAEVLRGVELELAPGETLAVLGPPGAGKSTLVHLLSRLYDPSAGRVLVGDVDLRELSRRELRRHIAVVSQEPFLFSLSLAENLRLPRPMASQAELEAATLEAAVHADVLRFGAGFETRVGERGVTLSGGQRQRIALARALLAEAPVLVLDDALSAVDVHTEEQILAALAARRGRHTTLVVTQRLSLLRAVDRVAVLAEGRIAQLGAPAELARRAGSYRRMLHADAGLVSTEMREGPMA